MYRRAGPRRQPLTMDKLRKKGQNIKLFFKTDWNIIRARRYARRSGREIRYGAGRYLANKFPIFQWIVSYSPKWLFGDVLSGVTVGVVLALQAVNLPSSAGGAISTQQTLIASWLPGFIYALTGSSKREIVHATHPLGLLNETGLLTCELSTQISASGRRRQAHCCLFKSSDPSPQQPESPLSSYCQP